MAVWKAEFFSIYYAFFQTSILLIFLLLSTGVVSAEKINNFPQAQFPEKITDINSRLIDVGKLAVEKMVTVVTLKATWCPICQEQLIRLKNNLNLIDTNRVTFLVLSPGPKNDLLEIKKNTSFPYPFIEDRKLRITKSLGLDISKSEITPSIFILNKQRKIRWMQRGRSGWYYGDEELLNEIGIVNWL